MTSIGDWVPDDQAHECTKCASKFTFLLRKHHCRSCGRVFCHKCSSHKAALVHSKHGKAPLVRVCDSCHLKLHLRLQQQQQHLTTPDPSLQHYPYQALDDASWHGPVDDRDLPETELYRTMTVCAKCALVEGRGYDLRPAVVLERNGRVYQRSACERHDPDYAGGLETLICSDASFWHRLMSYGAGYGAESKSQSQSQSHHQRDNGLSSPSSSASSSLSPSSSLPSSPSSLSDVEDLASRLVASRQPNFPSPPVMAEVVLFRGHQFVPDHEIDRQLRMYSVLYGWTAPPASSSAASSASLSPSASFSSVSSSSSSVSSPSSLSSANDDSKQATPLRGVSFVLRVTGGLVPKHLIATLNEKILRLEACSIAGIDLCPLLLDLSFERLIDLAALPGSALLRARVLPLARYFLTRENDDGNEARRRERARRRRDREKEKEQRAKEQQEGKEAEGEHGWNVQREAETEAAEEQEDEEEEEEARESFVREMEMLSQELASIDDLQLALLIIVDKPYPDLRSAFDFVFTHKGFIRFVIVSRERSPQDLFERLADPVPTVHHESQDPCELLHMITKATRGRLQNDDFMPVCALRSVEPLLEVLNVGRYRFRMSPLCAFGACLVSTKHVQNEPLSRLLDLERLHGGLLPIMQRVKAEHRAKYTHHHHHSRHPSSSNLSASPSSHSLNAASSSSDAPNIGLFTAKAIQKLIKSCVRPGAKLPDLFGFLGALSSSEQQSEARLFLRNMQFIVIHNTMDFQALDVRRRCECAMVTPSAVAASIGLPKGTPISKGGAAIAAACTGCI